MEEESKESTHEKTHRERGRDNIEVDTVNGDRRTAALGESHEYNLRTMGTDKEGAGKNKAGKPRLFERHG